MGVFSIVRCALLVGTANAAACTDLYKGKDKCGKMLDKIEKKPEKACAQNSKWIEKKECEATCSDLGEPYRYSTCGRAAIACADSDAEDRTPDWFKGKSCSKMAKKMTKKAPEEVCALNDDWVSKKMCEKTCFDLGEPYAYAPCGYACGDADCPWFCEDTAPPSWLKKGKTCAGNAKKFKASKDCRGSEGHKKEDWVADGYCEYSCDAAGSEFKFSERNCGSCDDGAPTCATCCGRCAAAEVDELFPSTTKVAGSGVLGCGCLETTAGTPAGVSFQLDTGGGDCYFDLHGATAGGAGGAGDDLIYVEADDVGATASGPVDDFSNVTAGLLGGAGDDKITLVGDRFRNVEGGDGDDILTVTGDDGEYVRGGAGSDNVYVYGKRNAHVYGDDAPMEESGDDTVVVRGDDNEYVYGGYGDDTLTVIGDRNMYIYGGGDDDVVTVQGDDNYDINGDAYVRLDGNMGDRSVDGDDVITVTGDGNTYIYGGGGDDVIEIKAESGSSAVGHVYGDHRDENGFDGADTITITASGERDVDYIYGGGGDDVIKVEADRPAADGGDNGGRGVGVVGGSGNDEITWTGEHGRVNGGDGNDVITVIGEGTQVEDSAGNDDVSCDSDCG